MQDVTIESLVAAARYRLAADLAASAERCSDQIRQSFEAARARQGLRRVLLDTDKVYKLPPRFVCPECGGRLLIEVSEWGSRDGLPTEDGIHLYCQAEEDELWESVSDNRDPEWEHRWWFSDWHPVRRQVIRGAARNVRVKVAQC